MTGSKFKILIIAIFRTYKILLTWIWYSYCM